jgi:hypothetical protein
MLYLERLAKGICKQSVSNLSSCGKSGMGRSRHDFIALLSYFK